MARLVKNPDMTFPAFDLQNLAPYRAEQARRAAALAAAEAASDALPPGEYVGRVLAFRVGDGYANYRVVRTHPLHLQWLGGGDNYQMPAAFLRGLRLQDVIEHVQAQERLRAIFGSPATRPERPQQP